MKTFYEYCDGYMTSIENLKHEECICVIIRNVGDEENEDCCCPLKFDDEEALFSWMTNPKEANLLATKLKEGFSIRIEKVKIIKCNG